jgi:RHH-type proline utilization regulon transcriptional repressor/proline dehydrogenase/delta 1-pyrroline-5-carboxylate dehydrogenase
MALAQAAQALAIGGAALVLLDGAPGAAATATIELWRKAGAPVALLGWDGAGGPQAGLVDVDWLASLQEAGLVAFAGPPGVARAMRIALSRQEGAIVPLVTEAVAPWRYTLERHLCIDATAAGGNAALLAASA